MEDANLIISKTTSDKSFLQHQIALYESLSHGSGIKGILTTAEQYFNNPMFVCDVSYNIIAASPLSKDMPYGIKYSKGKAYLDSIEIESMKRHKLLENIYNHATAFRALTPDHPNNPWIFCAIRINNVVTGHVGICYNEQEPIEDDLTLATVTAQVISIEMQKHDFFANKTGLKYEYFLTDLLEGQFEDIETIYSRIKLLDRKLHKYLCIITLCCDDPFDNTLFNKKQMEQLRFIYADSMSLVYKDNIVLLISQNKPIQFNDEKYRNLIDFLSRNHVKAGISQNFTDPMDACAYYNQSSKTLELGKAHSSEQVLFHSLDMIPFHLFNNCELSELKSYVHYQINELQQYDAAYHTELTYTLKAFLKQNRNATQTAEYLHIHRSTLFYRIKKMEEILSISINDSKTLFLYELSFGIQEYIYSENIVLSNTPNISETLNGVRGR